MVKSHKNHLDFKAGVPSDTLNTSEVYTWTNSLCILSVILTSIQYVQDQIEESHLELINLGLMKEEHLVLTLLKAADLTPQFWVPMCPQVLHKLVFEVWALN